MITKNDKNRSRMIAKYHIDMEHKFLQKSEIVHFLPFIFLKTGKIEVNKIKIRKRRRKYTIKYHRLPITFQQPLILGYFDAFRTISKPTSPNS